MPNTPKRRRPVVEDVWNIPNALTMARVVVIPGFLWILHQATREYCFWAAIVFTLAAITDALDGYLARRMGIESVFGKLLDPLADKLIVMASLVWMVPMGRIEPAVVVLLLAREFGITSLRSVAASEGMVIAAGKDGLCRPGEERSLCRLRRHGHGEKLTRPLAPPEIPGPRLPLFPPDQPELPTAHPLIFQH